MAFSGTVRDYSNPSRVGGVAVVIIGMDESFYPIFEGWPGMGRTGDTLIARMEGDYIVFLNRLRGQPYAPLELRYKVDSKAPRPSLYASSGIEGIEETTDYRGVKVLAAYRYIPETKWGFVVKEDYDDAFSSIHQLTRRVVYTMAGTFLLGFILSYFVSTRIAEPIIMMNQLAGRISEGDFSVSIPVKGKDEIGSLAVSFNHMAAALMEYRRQVDEKSAELERPTMSQKLRTVLEAMEDQDSGAEPLTGPFHDGRPRRWECCLSFTRRFESFTGAIIQNRQGNLRSAQILNSDG
jgi:HAMP domain-containing protein